MKKNFLRLSWFICIAFLIVSCTPQATAVTAPTQTLQPSKIPSVVEITAPVTVEATKEAEPTVVAAVETALPVEVTMVKPQLEATANLNCRKFPLNTARILGHAVKGELYDVLGMDISETWYLIPNPQKASDSVCWIFAADTRLLDAEAEVPIISATTR